MLSEKHHIKSKMLVIISVKNKLIKGVKYNIDDRCIY